MPPECGLSADRNDVGSEAIFPMSRALRVVPRHGIGRRTRSAIDCDRARTLSQASITFCSRLPAISILRGFAFSATGMDNLRTPSS
jgi:hypothetical protein